MTPEPTSGRPRRPNSTPSPPPRRRWPSASSSCAASPRPTTTGPTVCTEFDVTQLAEHLIGSVTVPRRRGGRRVRAAADGTTLEARVAAAAQATLEAWKVRGLDGTVKLGPHEMPAALALGILSVEFLVHAWDFAQATGQRITVSDGLTSTSWTWPARSSRPRAAGAASFADPVEAGPDAGLLDRLIAFTGRAVSAVH